MKVLKETEKAVWGEGSSRSKNFSNRGEGKKRGGGKKAPRKEPRMPKLL